MSMKAAVAVVLVSVSLSSAYIPCRQRSAQDFRADDNDCNLFHLCSIGRLVTFSCPAGSVFDERTHSCVPAYSLYDGCKFLFDLVFSLSHYLFAFFLFFFFFFLHVDLLVLQPFSSFSFCLQCVL